MRTLITVIVCLMVWNGYAQNPPQPKMMEYKPKNIVGIFYYDSNEVIKKIKVKKDEVKNKVIQELRDYNNKVKDIEFLNSVKLMEVETVVNNLGSQLRTNSDVRDRVRKLIESTIPPVRDTIFAIEKATNANMETFLNKKQYKKWIKYQKKIRRELLPKPPEANRNANRTFRNSRRMQNGMNQMGGRRF